MPLNHPSESKFTMSPALSKQMNVECMLPSASTAPLDTQAPKLLVSVSDNPPFDKCINAYWETLTRVKDIAKENNYDLTKALDLFKASFLPLTGRYELKLKMHCFAAKKILDDLIFFIKGGDLSPEIKQEGFDNINQYLTEASDQSLARLYRYNHDLSQSNDSLAKQIQISKDQVIMGLIKDFALSHHSCSETEADMYVALYMNKLIGSFGNETITVSHTFEPISDRLLQEAAECLVDNLTEALIIRQFIEPTMQSIDQCICDYFSLTLDEYQEDFSSYRIKDSDYLPPDGLIEKDSLLKTEIRVILEGFQAQLQCSFDENIYQATELFLSDGPFLIWPKVHPLIEIRVLDVLEEKGIFPISKDEGVFSLGRDQVRRKGGLLYVLTPEGYRRHLSSNDVKQASDQKLLASIDQDERHELVAATIETTHTLPAFLDFTPDLLFYSNSWTTFIAGIKTLCEDASRYENLISYLKHYSDTLSACFKQGLPSGSFLHNPQSICHQRAVRHVQQLLIDEAFSHADDRLFDTLLMLGISPNTHFEKGKTLVMQTIVAKHGNINRLRNLLHHKPDLKLVDLIEKKTAAMFAAEVGRDDMLRDLLRYDSSIIENMDANHHTALVLAAQNNNLKCIDALKKHHALTDHAVLDRVRTPLMAAALNNHHDAIEKLLEYGADVNRKDDLGRTPIMMAAMHQSLAQDYPSLFERMLRCDAKVNMQDDHGRTALMCASIKNNVNAIILLRSRGANINMEDNDGYSALSVAVVFQHIESIQMLLNFGARIHRPGLRESLQIPRLAANTGNAEVIKMIENQESGKPHSGVFIA